MPHPTAAVDYMMCITDRLFVLSPRGETSRDKIDDTALPDVVER